MVYDIFSLFNSPGEGPWQYEIEMEVTESNTRNPLVNESYLPRPEAEAAFFYGLFMRGVPLQKLREDIGISPQVAATVSRLSAHDPRYGRLASRIITYRKHVLAIFDSLIFQELDPPARTQ